MLTLFVTFAVGGGGGGYQLRYGRGRVSDISICMESGLMINRVQQCSVQVETACDRPERHFSGSW